MDKTQEKEAVKIQSRIDDLITKNKDLLKRRDNLKRQSQIQAKESSRLDELEIYLNKKLNLLRVTEETFSAEVQAMRDLVEEKRKIVDELNAMKNTKEQSRLDQLKIFERKVAETVPKFHNAPTVYTDANLMKIIEETKSKNSKIKRELDNIDREMKSLLSRHNLQDETFIIEDPEYAMEIANLKQLKAVCTNLNSVGQSSWKKVERENEDLDKIVQRNNRKLNNLNNS